jgi:putative effector of murein hydrolase
VRVTASRRRRICLARETTLLLTALAALQDQVAIIGVVHQTSELSVEVDTAVVAGSVVDIVVVECFQNLLQTDAVASSTRVRRSVTTRTSGLEVAARAWRY